MSERLTLLGLLADLKPRRMDLEAEAAGLISGLREKATKAAYESLTEVDADQILALASRLKQIQSEHADIVGRIRRIQKDLGE